MPTSFRYDEADRLTSKIVDDNTVATDGVFHCTNASWTAITYDDDDNRISEDAFQAQLDTTGCPGTAQKSGKGTYSYDRLGRITHGQAPFDTKTIPYVYDDAGNVVSETGFAYTYQNNRLLSRQALPGGLTTFAYDHFGNQNAETTAGQTTNTSYDAASHARRTTSPDGSWVEYAYDGLGRQVRRHTSTGEVTLFFRDQFSDDIALETNATDGPTARYVLDASGEPLANEKSDNSWQRGYYVSDPRGNLTMITRTYEDVVQAVFGYDPFGKEKPAETSKIGNWDSRLRFQMAPQDPKTKTYSIGPRVFNPDIYRFVGADNFVAAASNLDLQMDPLTGNRYLYAGSNPANMIDDGHAPHRAGNLGTWRCERLSSADGGFLIRLPKIPHLLAAKKRSVTCIVKCQVSGPARSGCWKLGYVTASATAKDRETACKMAKQLVHAKLPKGKGCYPRHCKEDASSDKSIEVFPF